MHFFVVMYVIIRQGCYQIGDQPDLRRLDLVINIPGEVQVLADVTVTSPFSTDSHPSNTHSTPPPVEPAESRAVLAAERRKHCKYDSAASRSGKKFLALAMDHGGEWGPEFRQFFNTMVNHYNANTGYPTDAIAGYWLRRIQCALQRGLARALVQRAHRVACRAIASNLSADAGASGEGCVHDYFSTAPDVALNPLWDKSWDYPAGAGVVGDCVKLIKL